MVSSAASQIEASALIVFTLLKLVINLNKNVLS